MKRLEQCVEWLRGCWEALRAWVIEPWDLRSRHEAVCHGFSRQQERIRLLERELAVARIEVSARRDEDGPARLTAAERERLAVLADAAGHVAAEAGWVLKEGWTEPDDGIPNRVAMERVLGRARCVINLMYDAGDVRGKEMMAWQGKFRRILARTTRYQQIDIAERES
jgi:hypothetical protein